MDVRTKSDIAHYIHPSVNISNYEEGLLYLQSNDEFKCPITVLQLQHVLYFTGIVLSAAGFWLPSEDKFFI
jgi:hypothetical protein